MKKKHNQGGGHAGSWKVAYADFVTAMMAFFLVMWLVNIAPDERKKEIANFFSSSVPFSLDVKNGAIGMMNGIGVMDTKEGEDTTPAGEKHKEVGKYNSKKNSFQEKKALKKKSSLEKSESKPIDKILKNPQVNTEKRSSQGSFFLREKASGGHQPSEETTGVQETLKYPNIKRWNAKKQTPLSNFMESEEESLEVSESIQKKMQKTIQKNIRKNIEEGLPKWLQKYIKIEESGKEIRITLFDAYHGPMFLSGQHIIQREIRKILSVLAESLKDKKYLMRIEGHTDATPYKGKNSYTNFDLSIDRANACKTFLEENGIEENQIEAIIGHGSSKPFNAKNPSSPENRRVELFLTPKKS